MTYKFLSKLPQQVLKPFNKGYHTDAPFPALNAIKDLVYNILCQRSPAYPTYAACAQGLPQKFRSLSIEDKAFII